VPTIRGVIFDLDGTLVDSNEAHVLAWIEALAEFGWTVTAAQVRPLIGMGADKLLPALIGVAEDGPDGRPISGRRARLLARFAPQLRPFPGVRALLDALRRRGLRLAVATSAVREDAERLLARAGLHDCFDVVVSADEAARSKPDPDIIEAAREALGLPPSEVVMVGDTRFDIAAARRAGITAIALRCGGSADETLAEAAAIYDDPADLLAQLETSPLA
jgi:HAD superfamily hydrolase (TIGR01509 family)